MSKNVTKGEPPIAVGMVGLGTVGTGVVKILWERFDLLSRRIGAEVVLKKVAVKNPRKTRDVPLPPGAITGRIDDLIEDPEIRVIIEVMGGTDTAFEVIRRAAQAGKHVVTANKALLALRAGEVLEICGRHDVDLGIEASVCGGVPIIRTLREGLSGDEVEFLAGVVNGTSNYILGRMEEQGLAFADALKEAQALGYAEADPTMDVDGTDSAHKLAILASIAYGVKVDFRKVPYRGIRSLKPVDFEIARDLGYRIKLLATLERDDDRIAASVLPTMVPRHYLIAAVDGAHNAVYIHGGAVGPLMLYGRGAGQGPTANSIVADLVEICRNIVSDTRRRVHLYGFRDEALRNAKIRPLADHVSKTFLRMMVMDTPGVIAAIAKILGDAKIGIHSARLAGISQGQVTPMFFLLHECRYGDVEKAVAKIDKLGVVLDKSFILPIEDRRYGS